MDKIYNVDENFIKEVCGNKKDIDMSSLFAYIEDETDQTYGIKLNELVPATTGWTKSFGVLKTDFKKWFTLFEDSNPIKSLKGYLASKCNNLEEYLEVGDEVSEDLENHFIVTLPPASMTRKSLQLGEPDTSTKDTGEQVYMTITKEYPGKIGVPVYAGLCTIGSNETIELSNLWGY